MIGYKIAMDILKNYTKNNQWDDIYKMYSGFNFEEITNPNDLHHYLNEFYVGCYNNKNYEECFKILKMYEKCHIEESTIKNSNYMLKYLKETKNMKIIATYDANRVPVNNEIIICYGEYPHCNDNLTHNNPIRRHISYFYDVDHDEVEYDHIWDFYDHFYLLNLDERRDRWIQSMRELALVGIPLNKVTRFSALKSTLFTNKNMCGWAGCMQSHIKIAKEIIDKNYKNTLVMEDDITFVSDILRIKKDLKTFIERNYEYDVLLYSSSKYYKIEPYDDLLSYSYQECTTTCAFAMSYEGVRKVYKVWLGGFSQLLKVPDHEKYKYAVDRIWSTIQKDKKFFIFNNKFAFQRPSYSNITQNVEFHYD